MEPSRETMYIIEIIEWIGFYISCLVGTIMAMCSLGYIIALAYIFFEIDKVKEKRKEKKK